MLLKVFDFLKKNYSVILFFFFLLFLLFFMLYTAFKFDSTWEYGMSHAIRVGEVPYRDFNTVCTPLFIFLFSIGLFVKDSFAMFLLEFAITYTVMFYFLEKIIGKGIVFVVILASVFLYNFFLPSYNSFTFALIILLLYLEKNQKSDYLIGFFLGLLILSKHTIGLPVAFFAIISNFHFENMKKKVMTMMIPIGVFLVYLLVTNSFYEFFDLCFLGLFDFASKNTLVFSYYYFGAFLLVGIMIYMLFQNPKNRLLYYLLGSVFFIIPICDRQHFIFFAELVAICFFEQHSFSKKYLPFCYFIILLFLFVNINVRWSSFRNAKISSYQHFEYTLTEKKNDEAVQLFFDLTKKYQPYTVLSMKGMYFDIISNHEINYFSIPLYGNYGYHGTEKMIQKIEKMHNCYFFVEYSLYHWLKTHPDEQSQFMIELADTVIENAEFVEESGLFWVYYKE